MSKEFKAPRDIETIQREYTQVCMRAGDLQYKIDAHKKDLAVLNDTLRDLNFEALASSQAAAEAAKAQEAKTPSEPQTLNNVTSISGEKTNG